MPRSNGLLEASELSVEEFDLAVRVNQQHLAANLKPAYDFIVCGSGSSGSVVARRLAEDSKVNVLLLEAGGSDEHEAVSNPLNWTKNLGSERDWAFRTRPNQHLNGRALLWSMGKVLGGGSSINGMVWSRGHKADWDFFAEQTGDSAWSYEEVLKIFRRIEDWRGQPDPARRGQGGIVYVQPPPDPNPIALAMLEAARSLGFPVFPDQNGELMEGSGGCSLANLRIRDGKRQSIFRSYVYPYMHRANLTVLSGALVTRLRFDGRRVVGVDVDIAGQMHQIGAKTEVILSLGAIHSPKVLLKSGIGDSDELRRFGIKTVQHLPGVGRNLQDHIMVAACVWEYTEPLEARGNAAEATILATTDPAMVIPDLHCYQLEQWLLSPDVTTYQRPPHSWAMLPGVARPRSVGSLHLTGPNATDPMDIDANLLSDPADLKASVAAVNLCREIGNSEALRPFTKREVAPGNLSKHELEDFVRNAIVAYWHQTCTCKMGRDEMSVVNGSLKVHGVSGLRVADGSVMPHVTIGNTMAPCVIIGERAAESIRREYGLSDTAS